VRILIGQDNHNRGGLGRTGVVKLRLAEEDGEWSMTPEWKFDPEARVAYDEAGEGPGFLTHLSGTGDGCGGVWGTPAVDVARDVVVFGTASCGRTPAGGIHDTEDVAGEKVYAVRYSDGAELWRYNPPRPWGSKTDDDFGAALQLFEVDGELVAGAGGKDGWYYALDALGGQLRWATQMGQPGHLSSGFAIGGVLGSPAVGEANGRPAVFVTTAISTPVGAPFDQGSPESIDRSLAEDPGRMLSLHALDADTGAVLWRSVLTRQTYGHPTYANGVVLVTSTAGFAVEAFEASTGVPLWRSQPLNGAPSSGVSVTDLGIFVGAGTRQTDAGFKIAGEDSSVPGPIRDAIGATPLVDLVGSDPQERLSGVWSFRLGI
jgi:outer membrane protein assembly factor BamB